MLSNTCLNLFYERKLRPNHSTSILALSTPHNTTVQDYDFERISFSVSDITSMCLDMDVQASFIAIHSSAPFLGTGKQVARPTGIWVDLPQWQLRLPRLKLTHAWMPHHLSSKAGIARMMAKLNRQKINGYALLLHRQARSTRSCQLNCMYSTVFFLDMSQPHDWVMADTWPQRALRLTGVCGYFFAKKLNKTSAKNLSEQIRFIVYILQLSDFQT